MFPNLPSCEDAHISRILLTVPDKLQDAVSRDTAKYGHCAPRLVALQDDKLTKRLQIINGWTGNTEMTPSSLFERMGISTSVDFSQLHFSNETFFEKAKINSGVGRHFAIIKNSSGIFLVPGLQNDVFESHCLINPGLDGQPYQDKVWIIHGNNFEQKPIRILCNFKPNVQIVPYHFHPDTPLGISFQDSIFLLKLLSDIPIPDLKRFLKPWSKVLKHNENFQRAFQMLFAIKLSSFGTYLSHIRVFSKHIIQNGDEFHTAFQNLGQVVQGLFKDQIHPMEFKGFIFDRLWNVKYRTVRAYFSGIIFFYEHCGPSKLKFWEAYPKVKKYLVDLGRRFDEIPQGSASLNWDQMQKLFKYILSDFQNDLIDTQMFFDVCIISFWCLLRTSEMIDLHFVDVVLFTSPLTAKKSARICIVGSKTSSVEAPVSFITIHQVENPEWKLFCPIEALERRFAKRAADSTFIFSLSNGKKLNLSLTSTIFKQFASGFRERYPTMLSSNEKLTFYTFRISSLGFLMITVGFTLQEAQLMIRHAPGSRVTQQVYLAKSKAAAGASARERLSAWMNNNSSNPEKVTFILNPDGTISIENNELDSDLWLQSLPEKFRRKFRNFF